MFDNLLDKSYFFYEGSNAAKMNESERVEILNALTTFYEMSELTEKEMEVLETIFIIVFNFSEPICINRFKYGKANLLLEEVKKDFIK